MDVLMPQLGETVAEGKITKWFKNAGDVVQAGDNLFEIETDKTSMEVPATFAGTLSAINVHVGEVAKVGAVVAVITDAGEAPPVPAKPVVARPSAEPARPGPRAVQASDGAGLDPWNAVRTPERNFGSARRSDGTTSTPLARRLAAERGIDIAEVIGTGPRAGSSPAMSPPRPIAGTRKSLRSRPRQSPRATIHAHMRRFRLTR
jgi:pyruvate dehydrogenase E2 component (dihydrolipoamide acetyltransferase)